METLSTNSVLSRTINDLHATIEGQLKTSLQLAIELGGHLAEVKSGLKHGELSKWIEDNLTFKVRTAQRYMRLFENKEKFNEINGITEAYKVLNASRVTYLEQGTDGGLSCLIDNGIEITERILQRKNEMPDDMFVEYLEAIGAKPFMLKLSELIELLDPERQRFQELEDQVERVLFGLSGAFEALKKIKELGLRTEKHDVWYELMENQSICDGNEQH